MGMPTLLDVAKHNGNDAVVGLIDETARKHPELDLIFARPIKGQSFKTVIRTSLGNSQGSFRNVNEGTAPIKHGYKNVKVETAILNPIFQCDKAAADEHEDGAEAYIATENSGTLEGELQALCKQAYYGITGFNPKGFPGMMAAVSAAMTVDATGNTADTGSSVWAIKTGPKDVCWVWGQGGKMEMDDPIIQLINDPNDATKQLTGYVSSLIAYPGLAIGSIYSIGRIKNLTAQDGKTLDDDMLADLLAKFPEGQKPDFFLMSRRSRRQLQASRTATTPTGAYVPRPTDHDGIPIYGTDSILDTEAIA